MCVIVKSGCVSTVTSCVLLLSQDVRVLSVTSCVLLLSQDVF